MAHGVGKKVPPSILWTEIKCQKARTKAMDRKLRK
jgi:hypothetical protein